MSNHERRKAALAGAHKGTEKMQDLSHYTFGVEFEVLLPLGTTTASGAAAISRLTGFPVILAALNQRVSQNSDTWKIVPDGSVRGVGTPCEFVSPVLQGEAGLEQVRKICAAFNSIGAESNQSCGFHVHVSRFRADLSFFKTLVKLYARFETVIDSLMPPSRRETRNTYCRSIARATSGRIDSAHSVDSVIEAATGLDRKSVV